MAAHRGTRKLNFDAASPQKHWDSAVRAGVPWNANCIDITNQSIGNKHNIDESLLASPQIIASLLCTQECLRIRIVSISQIGALVKYPKKMFVEFFQVSLQIIVSLLCTRRSASEFELCRYNKSE